MLIRIDSMRRVPVVSNEPITEGWGRPRDTERKTIYVTALIDGSTFEVAMPVRVAEEFRDRLTQALDFASRGYTPLAR